MDSSELTRFSRGGEGGYPNGGLLYAKAALALACLTKCHVVMAATMKARKMISIFIHQKIGAAESASQRTCRKWQQASSPRAKKEKVDPSA